MSKGLEERYSKTAIYAALYRAVAYKEFKNQGLGPDYLAEYFLPALHRFVIKFKIIRASIIGKSNKLTPGVYGYMLARTAFFDNIVIDTLNNGIPQIVLLGAGYDTRAYRFADLNHVTKVFELDIATTQSRKKTCLKKALIDFHENVALAPIDFNKESLKDVLEKAGYKDNVKTLFVWEGVSYYLEPGSVDATLEFVAHSSHDESVMAFDYAIPISEDNLNYYGVKEFADTWKKHRKGEPFNFAINDDELASFL